MTTYLKPALAAIAVYILGDAVWTYLLAFIDFDELHAFLAMFSGMFVGGYLARNGFIPVALGIAVVISLLTYIGVAMMREQSVISLILEQHILVSVGSLVGAVTGAWVGQWIAAER